LELERAEAMQGLDPTNAMIARLKFESQNRQSNMPAFFGYGAARRMTQYKAAQKARKTRHMVLGGVSHSTSYGASYIGLRANLRYCLITTVTTLWPPSETSEMQSCEALLIVRITQNAELPVSLAP
jgi:hypothetical protein